MDKQKREKQYQHMCSTGSNEPARRRNEDFYNTTYDTPVNRMKGYANKSIRVMRKGQVVAERKVDALVLDVLNNRTETAEFRRKTLRKS